MMLLVARIPDIEFAGRSAMHLELPVLPPSVPGDAYSVHVHFKMNLSAYNPNTYDVYVGIYHSNGWWSVVSLCGRRMWWSTRSFRPTRLSPHHGSHGAVRLRPGGLTPAHLVVMDAACSPTRSKRPLPSTGESSRPGSTWYRTLCWYHPLQPRQQRLTPGRHHSLNWLIHGFCLCCRLVCRIRLGKAIGSPQ